MTKMTKEAYVAQCGKMRKKVGVLMTCIVYPPRFSRTELKSEPH